MNNLYKDSKEFPLYNFERIKSTGDFGYMVKGYDGQGMTDADVLEMKFNEIVQDYVLSLNNTNLDIAIYGRINAGKIDLMKLLSVSEIIRLQLEILRLTGKENITVIHSLLEGIRVQRADTLEGQLAIIERKIDKVQNDISEAVKKLEKNAPEGETDADINQMIVNVELILERSIDLKSTTLYRFGLMQEQARQKVEIQAKNAHR